MSSTAQSAGCGDRIWKISADTGGTFTDIVAVGPGGEVRTAKVLSTGRIRIRCLGQEGESSIRIEVRDMPDHFLDGIKLESGQVVRRCVGGCLWYAGARLRGDGYLEIDTGMAAPVLGAHWVTHTPLTEPLPPVAMRVATTRGTNALLEGKGAPVQLFLSEGLEDLLRIGNQTRPDLFARPISPRRLLFKESYGLAERVDPAGQLIHCGSREDVRDPLPTGVAVVSLCNGYLNPEEERKIAARLEGHGWSRVIAAAEVSNLPGYLRRTETAVVEGYLAPTLDAYLDGIEQAEGVRDVRVMTSAGGIVDRSHFRAVDSLLSGPAGGVVGAAAAAKRAGIGSFLAFDMGGTSTDVSRFDGDLAYRSELKVGDAHIYSEALRIDTVAAGGGSICGFDGFAYTVGPDSAGADPGPACYGRGGPLTLTDVHLLLGRIDPERFRFSLDREAAERALTGVLEGAGRENASSDEVRQVLEGFRMIANETMESALREISIRDGLDPSGFALLSFGGGGGLHACALAEGLGIRLILQPGRAGILSADGLSSALPEQIVRESVLQPLVDFVPTASEVFDRMDQSALRRMEPDEDTTLEWKREAFLRLAGQESTLVCEWKEGVDLAAEFHRQFEEVFGFRQDRLPLEVASIRVRLREVEEEAKVEVFPEPLGDELGGRGEFIDGEILEAGACGVGPCVISQEFGTLVVEPGWRFSVGTEGSLRLERMQLREGREKKSTLEEVEHELFRNRFAGIVDAMGEMLQRTALSVNIRERLDFSCALLDGEGYLAVNAPHIPVHLGAMGYCVRAVSDRLDWKEGDIAITNHPGFGGSHLPDVTVLAPIFAAAEMPPVAFLAVRAHHAEIGGVRAGSMPADAHSLAEEGVVIPPFHLFREGINHTEKLRRILTNTENGNLPSRSPEINLADVYSQVAAVREGQRLIQSLLAENGAGKVEYYLGRILKQSEAWMRQAIDRIARELGERTAEVQLDGGQVIRVRGELAAGGNVLIDCAGTETGKGAFQCPLGVSLSAVLYVCRLLVDRDVPLNEGLLRAVDLAIPEGCLLAAPFEGEDTSAMPPVVAGNVEVSQRFVEALIRLFGIEADSQNTMNNVIFGNDRFSHYETLAGGSGASARGPGASAVQVHMTNTAITDVEVLERRFPVKILRFGIRPESGGNGAHPGGCGLVREYRFEEEVELSLLTQHRLEGPAGCEGGGSGLPGSQTLIYPDGREERLPYACTLRVAAGTRLRVETPGGGGWGAV
tara:strand:- start:5054 stop:8788 length:3735 start_codon:yes stop_codon:yes gene_type:complete